MRNADLELSEHVRLFQYALNPSARACTFPIDIMSLGNPREDLQDQYLGTERSRKIFLPS